MATAPAPSPLSAPASGLRLSALADDLAAGLRPPADVWRSHGITTRAEAAAVTALPAFQQLLDEAVITWHSREALGVRVKVKAGALVEDALIFMHAGIVSPLQPLSQRVAAFNALAKMAGVDMPPEARATGAGGAGAGVGAGVSITMDFGGGNVVGVKVGGGGGGEETPTGSDDTTFTLDPAAYIVGDTAGAD